MCATSAVALLEWHCHEVEMKYYNDAYGNTWITGSALTCASYGGGSVVGMANILWLRSYAGTHEECNLGATGTYQCDGGTIAFHVGSGGFVDGKFVKIDKDMSNFDILIRDDIYGEQAFIREGTACKGLREALDGLETYPIIDDDYVTDVEEQWERFTWEEDAQYELIAKAPVVHGHTLEHFIQDVMLNRAGFVDMDDLLWRAYRRTCADLSYQPEYENLRARIDTDFLAPTFAVHVMRLLHKAVIKRR